MISGGCRCGAVRFTASGEPRARRACWCRDCQYFAAGSATVNIFFPSDAVTWEGERRFFESEADSGNAMRRGFCGTCGTPMTTAVIARPDMIGIRVGTLDDPESAGPQSVIWADSAPSWASINVDLPKVPKQPAPL